VELVLVTDIQHNAVQSEDAVDQPGQIADESFGVFMQHHLLAQFIQPLYILTPLFSLQGLPPGALRHPAHHQAASHERSHGYPLLSPGQQERV